MRIRVLVAVLLVLTAPAVAAAYDRLVNPFHSCSISGTPEYNTLQDAVTAAAPGDQIGVCPGTYDQAVLVTKPGLTFTGIGSVLIIGNSQSACFNIVADGVTVRYFAIQQCGDAIQIGASGVLIQNNTLQFNTTGVFVVGPNNIVQSNLIEDNINGIAVVANSDGTAIKNNTVHRGDVGIVLTLASGVIVNKNSVQGASQFGIVAQVPSDSTISFNSVSFSGTGIELTAMGTGNQVTRNVVTRSMTIDCSYDNSGSVTFSRNTCGTENPAGAWD
jgi:parallel beta-helix repeat protein